MKNNLNKLFGALLAGSMLSATGAYAGFYMEGLEPFVMPYCEEPAPSDPVVASPGVDWSTMTPDETFLEDGKAYTPADCVPRSRAGARTHKPATSTYKVPQK
jgi:hypothetical protein